MNENPSNTGQETNRRDFFKKAGKRALWVAPTVTVLMTAASQPLKATGGYHHTFHNYNFKPRRTYNFSWFHFFGR